MKQSEKQKEWKQNDYQNKKDSHRIRQQERRAEIKVFIESLKGACVVCGETEKACIDFHHKDPNEKEFTIANAGQRKWSNDKIIKEVEKCVSICSNHHRLLHYYDLNVDETIERFGKVN